MGRVKPTWHNSRFDHSDRSEPYYLEYLNCREQGKALIERQFTAIFKIGNEKRQTSWHLFDRIAEDPSGTRKKNRIRTLVRSSMHRVVESEALNCWPSKCSQRANPRSPVAGGRY